MGIAGLAPLGRVAEVSQKLTSAMAEGAVDADESAQISTLRDSVDRWATGRFDSARIDSEAKIDAALYREAAELGLLSLTIPEEYEGAGLSLTAAGEVIAALARHDRSVATSIGLHCGLGVRGLIRFGSEALKKTHLPRLAAGEKIAAFAATEPGAGSHLAGVSTVGRSDGNGKLTVNGQKCFVTNGGIADVYTILAQTPGLAGARHGYSLLLLQRDLKGLSIGAEEHKMGIRGSSTTDLILEDVEIPIEHVIGEPAKGLDLIQDVLAWGRTLMSAGCVGSARAAYEQALSYTLTRRQFGKPISEFGLSRAKVVEMQAVLFAMESMVRLTSAMVDIGGSDIVWESTATKIFASEGAGKVADHALQLHGGNGFIEEYGLARIVRDCRVTRIFEGANEVLRLHLTNGAQSALQRDYNAPALADSVESALQTHAAHYDRLHGEATEALLALRKAYGFRMVEHQELLAGAADALIALFALAGVILRVNAELRQGMSAADREKRIALLDYCVTYFSRALDDGLRRTADAEPEALTRRISEGLYDEVRQRL